jgi:hypothetical protein
VANEPAAVLAVLPTDADTRDYVVSELEPIFEATPALRMALSSDTDEGNRATRSLLIRARPDCTIDSE